MTDAKRLRRATRAFWTTVADSLHQTKEPNYRGSESPEKLFIKDVIRSNQWKHSDPEMRIPFSSFLVILVVFLVYMAVVNTMRDHGFKNFSSFLLWAIIWFNGIRPFGTKPLSLGFLAGESSRATDILLASAVLPIQPVVARRAVYLQPVVTAAAIIVFIASFEIIFYSTNGIILPLTTHRSIALVFCPLFVAGLNTCLAVGNHGIGVLHAIAAIGIWFLPSYAEEIAVSYQHPAWHGDLLVGIAALGFAAIVPLLYLRSDARSRS
jgi:hypothetical protein